MQTSIDGYVAGPNGEMDWMLTNWDDELKARVTALTDPVDTILLGRKLAEGFIPYWKSSPPDEDPRGIDKFTTTPIVVFSKTLTESQWDNADLATGDIVDEINQLKQENGGDIMAYGGANFAASLIRNHLVDDYHLFVNPTAIAQGMPIFTDMIDRQRLQLKAARAYPCGIVELHYQPRLL
jgi:dihydrofolate reductase